MLRYFCWITEQINRGMTLGTLDSSLCWLVLVVGFLVTQTAVPFKLFALSFFFFPKPQRPWGTITSSPAWILQVINFWSWPISFVKGRKWFPAVFWIYRAKLSRCVWPTSLLPLPHSPPHFPSKWNSFLAEEREEGLRGPHAASFKLWGRADGSCQCFLSTQILFPKAKLRLCNPGWFCLSPWGLEGPHPRLGQCRAGRDLPVAGFRVKKCSGIQDGHIVLPSQLGCVHVSYCEPCSEAILRTQRIREEPGREFEKLGLEKLEWFVQKERIKVDVLSKHHSGNVKFTNNLVHFNPTNICWVPSVK